MTAAGDSAIVVDEIGIETARLRDLVLKTLYQPVLRVRDGALEPVAVTASVAPYRGGRAISAGEFDRRLDPRNRAVLDRIGRLLGLRNHRNIGVAGISLIFRFKPLEDDIGTLVAEIDRLAGQPDELVFDPSRLVCGLADAGASSHEDLAEIAARLRGRGLRVAVEDFDGSQPLLDRIERLKPDMVGIEPGWFGSMTALPATKPLFARLVRGFHALGAAVFLRNIATPADLQAALDAGADLVQGALLWPPRLAGSAFDLSSWPTGNFLAAADNVVRFSR